LGFIDDTVCARDDIIVLGDLNFRCDNTHRGIMYCCTAFSRLAISNCDSLCSVNDGFTYFNNSLGQGSFIDHFSVSSWLRSLIQPIYIEHSMQI
jgi:hypothetical protein